MTRRRVIFIDPETWTRNQTNQEEDSVTDYPPEWHQQPSPDPLDPRLGDVLDPIRPTAAERALVADLVHRYVSRDTTFGETYQHFWRDRYTDHRWAHVFLGLLEQFATTAVGAQGEPLSVARTEGDLQAARDDVIEFGSQP